MAIEGARVIPEWVRKSASAIKKKDRSQTETPSKLAHVAGLWVFSLPKGYRKNFWREFIDGLDDAHSATPPFNYKLTGGLDLPAWVEDESFDLDNHVRFAALPKPGSTGQLLEMDRLARKRKFPILG